MSLFDGEFHGTAVASKKYAKVSMLHLRSANEHRFHYPSGLLEIGKAYLRAYFEFVYQSQSTPTHVA